MYLDICCMFNSNDTNNLEDPALGTDFTFLHRVSSFQHIRFPARCCCGCPTGCNTSSGSVPTRIILFMMTGREPPYLLNRILLPSCLHTTSVWCACITIIIIIKYTSTWQSPGARRCIDATPVAAAVAVFARAHKLVVVSSSHLVVDPAETRFRGETSLRRELYQLSHARTHARTICKNEHVVYIIPLTLWIQNLIPPPSCACKINVNVYFVRARAVIIVVVPVRRNYEKGEREDLYNIYMYTITQENIIIIIIIILLRVCWRERVCVF